MNIFLSLILTSSLWALTYRGEAYREGKLIYHESHEIEDVSGRAIKSLTIYKDPQGKEIARLQSDYTDSLTVPVHQFKDERFKIEYGVKKKDQNLLMFNGDKDQMIESKKDLLMVAGQGLHYYLVHKLETFSEGQELKLQFIIPGQLDWYEFKLIVKEVSAQQVKFDILINSWFLRIFSPKLEMIYDKPQKRLVYYSGLSNLLNEKGQNQKVEIKYFYPD